MTVRSQLVLDTVSVVLIAQIHNPSIINVDFLRDHRIVDRTWEPESPITTPGYSRVGFANGLDLTVDESRCIVSQRVGHKFQASYVVHEVAIGYVKTLPHIPYRAVGLNWLLHMPRKSPRSWLVRRFLKPGPWLKADPTIEGAELKLELTHDGATCFLTLGSSEVAGNGGGGVESVTGYANFHYDGPFKPSATLEKIIGDWVSCQDFLINALTKLLTGRLG